MKGLTPPVGSTGVMKIMGPKGDEKLAWDIDDTKQVVKAQSRFAELLSKGFRAFLMDKTGKRGKQIDEFDPSAESILMVPAMVGG